MSVGCQLPDQSRSTDLKFAPLPPLPEKPNDTLPAPGPIKPVRDFSIALVGEVRGEIEPCGCPTLPYGGFVRRENLLNQLRKKGTLFHFDAGELLLKGIATLRSENRMRRADLLRTLSHEAGVDAWAPGPTDLLALGPDGLTNLRNDAQTPPLVSATWYRRTPTGDAGEPLLPPFVVAERDGIRIGVIGLSDAPTDANQSQSIFTKEPVQATQQTISLMPQDLDLYVALGNIPNSSAAAVADLPQVDLVLTTSGGHTNEPTQSEQTGSWVIESADRGRFVKLVQVRLGSEPGQPLLNHPEESAWKTLETLQTQIANREAKESLTRPEVDDEAPDRNSVIKLFESIEKGRNLIHFSTLPLADDLDPISSDENTENSTTQHALTQFKSDQIASATQRAQAPTEPDEPTYKGSQGCVNCHTNQFARWSFSDHARAWEPLIIAEETDNPECIACHTTGFGEPGGFGEPSRSNLRKFKAVQCEACHGPMAGHPSAANVSSAEVTESVCLACHDAANSPNFDFTTYMPKATCLGE